MALITSLKEADPEIINAYKSYNLNFFFTNSIQFKNGAYRTYVDQKWPDVFFYFIEWKKAQIL